MATALFFPEALRARLNREARAAYPRECCGLIEGAREGDAVRACALHPTRNLSTRADRFEIDPSEHVRLLRALRGTRREIVGCYHSHPNGRAALSDEDRANAWEDGFVWVIAALTSPHSDIEVAAFEAPAARALDLRD